MTCNLPFVQKIARGLGHGDLYWAGRLPGMLDLCRQVDNRLAWTAAKLPPTPEVKIMQGLVLFEHFKCTLTKALPKSM